MNEKFYLCWYSTGQYEYYEKNVFITNNEMLAQFWVYRIERLMERLKTRYEIIE